MIAARERRDLGEGARQLLTLYEKAAYPHALNEVEVLAKSGPLPPDVLGIAALCLVAVERYGDAVRMVQEALRGTPDRAWLHQALAAAEAGQGRLDAAVAAATRAVQLMPGEAGYGASLAHYLRLSGQVEPAVRAARQAVLLDTGHAGALCELGLALAAAGDRTGALAQLGAAQAAAPDAPEGFLFEGELHLEGGAVSAARQALHAALARRPGYTPAEDALARTLSAGAGRAVLVHLLNLGRVTVVGWAIIAFLYYLLFRMLEFLWKTWPATLPVGRSLLGVTMAYLLGGLALGRLLRFAFSRGWPGGSGRHVGPSAQ